MKSKKNKGLARIIKAYRYSQEGLKAAFENEEAFRQECILAGILIPLAFFMPVTMISKILMIVSVLAVLLVELLNSAIEAVVDRISEEEHPLSKQAKDMGSAAVLISLIIAGTVWGLALLDAYSQYVLNSP